MTLSDDSTLNRSPSKEQARAWLATVLAPLVEALRVEHRRLDTRILSFRAGLGDFEFLWDCSNMVSRRSYSNLEQIFRFYPTLELAAARHDGAIRRLREACASACERLMQTDEFQQLSAERSQTERQALAEYVVNDARELPEYYGLAELWNRQMEAFLRLRQLDALEPYFAAVSTEASKLTTEVERMLELTKAIQANLADEHALPPVEPAMAEMD